MLFDILIFASVTGAFLWLLAFFFGSTAAATPSLHMNYDYDVIIVGGSIAGPVLAKALHDQRRRVLLVERSLFDKPDRIVGELLQPGGMMALEKLGLKECATSVGSLCTGYVVVDDDGKLVSLPYEKGHTGVSFHFGDFVNNLRRYVWNHCQSNVEMVEGTVTELLTAGKGAQKRVYGVKYLRDVNYEIPEKPFDHPLGHVRTPSALSQKTREPRVATAPLIVLCDGGSSMFKNKHNHYRPARNYHSNFVGLILEGITLPQETRGHVFFGKTGPILSYRLDANEVRFLVDYNKPELPSLEEQSLWLREVVAPRLPESIRAEFLRVASDVKNLRSMPVARYPQLFPSTRGLVGIGDHGNQRHPLTGGGMTCAFRDAIRLAHELQPISSLRTSTSSLAMGVLEGQIQDAISRYTKSRFLHSSCINILSWALYAVFGALDLRSACFDYFLMGGDCVRGPMALLSGLDPSPWTLLRHYIRVMLNGAWNMMAKTGSYTGQQPGALKQLWNVVTFFLNPLRLWKAISLLVEATLVFTPLAWMEFVCIWRFVESTSTLAQWMRAAEVKLLRVMGRGKSGRPVGI